METTTTASKTGRPYESQSQSFDQGHQSGHAIRDAATEMGQRVEDVASSLLNKANQAAATTGRKIESVADQVRSHMPESGVVGAASSKLADSLDYSGMYLEDQGLSGMIGDIAKLIRRNPITSLMAGMGMGYLFARATTCRSS